ncbi:hypothetical protein GCM10009087_41130 [Sphingomonas oligophenolica]|uniref:DUF4365 domain-containing protein n=1 Tax=Sphingomonas oligophenolica TaxID=301154 RepID=A0ABU9YCU3_9SPHN
MKNIATPNYPDLAETRFQELCDWRNVTRHKVNQDRTGWDYLLEFERDRITGLPHDKQPGSAAARIQVKSKAGGSTSTSVKLSNALRFTREPDFCFIVLFWFSKDGLSEKIYARHFHEPLMEAALRRAREADRDAVDALHRIRVPIGFTAEDDHSGDLIEWMRGICDRQPENYASDKRKLAEGLGYNDSRIHGKFTVRREDLQTLIDHSVGLAPVAPIESVIFQDKRFGIDARIPVFEGKPTVSHINVAPQPASLTVTGLSGHSATIDGEMRSFALPGLPLATARGVFSSPTLNVTIQGDGHFGISYNLQADTPYALSSLKAFCDFQRASRSPMTIRLNVANMPPIETTAPAQQSKDDDWFRWLGAVADCLSLVCRTDNAPTFTIQQIVDQEDAILRFVDSVIDGECTVQFTLDREIEPLSGLRNLLGYVMVEIGEFTFWAILRRPCLRYETEGLRHVVVFGNPVILDGVAVRSSMQLQRETVQERFKKLSQQIGTGSMAFNGGNLSALGGESLDINLVGFGQSAPIR